MQKYRSFILPIAITIGLFFHHYIAFLTPAVPYLIFSILFFNFAALDFSKLKFSMMDVWLVLFQVVVSISCYALIRPLNEVVAQGVLIGVLCPVAAAVVVISCMLGANRERITTYTLVGNAMVAIVAPIYFSFIGTHVDMPFFTSLLLIFSKIFPIIVLPMILAIITQKFMPKVNGFFVRYGFLSFYLWAMALTVTIGQTIDFIFLHGKGNTHIILWLSAASLIACVIQFAFGKKVGKKYGDKVAGGQALGQRNTALAIWMSYTYLDPLASIFPATYSIWQNLYNSYQLWQHDRAAKSKKH